MSYCTNFGSFSNTYPKMTAGSPTIDRNSFILHEENTVELVIWNPPSGFKPMTIIYRGKHVTSHALLVGYK